MRVTEQIERANRYGLNSESHVAFFVLLAYATDPDFDLEEQARGILADQRTSADEKVTRLRHWVEVQMPWRGPRKLKATPAD